MSDIPEPLVASEVDLRGLDWMPLFGDDLFGSETWVGASADGKVAALRLWWRSFCKEVPAGSLPDNDKLLADYAGYGVAVKAWSKIRKEVMRGWVLCSDGRLYHRYLCENIIPKAWKERMQYRADQERLKAWRKSKKNGSETTPETADETRFKTHDETATDSQSERRRQGQGQLEAKASYTDSEAARAPATSASVEIIRDFDDIRASIWGDEQRRPWPGATDKGTAERWIALGLGREAISEFLHSRLAQRHAAGSRPIDTLSYFDAGIRELLERKPAAEVNADAAPPMSATENDWVMWKVRADRFRETGSWPHPYGFPPGDQSCRMPKDLQAWALRETDDEPKFQPRSAAA